MEKTGLSLETKLDIINMLETSETINFTKTGQIYGVSRYAIANTWKTRDQIKKDGEECRNLSRKRKRKFKGENVEKALLVWMDEAKQQNTKITGSILKEKAQQFATEMGLDFQPSSGWLSRFQWRNNISFKQMKNEQQFANSKPLPAAAKFQFGTLPRLLSTFLPDDIYNAEETALFYKGFPDRGYSYRGVKFSRGRSQKDRLTALVCTNMSGSDKRKLLIIGNSKKPNGFPCRSHISKLPVTYKQSSNGLMTPRIFTEYLQAWDQTLQASGRKVVLLVESCASHPAVPDLAAIRLEFLPRDTEISFQPCQQGIIRELKCHYRSALNRLIISEVDADGTKSAADITRSITMLRAIYLMYDAWTKVSVLKIVNSFRRASFSVKDTAIIKTEQVETYDEESFPTPVNLNPEVFNEFVDLDSQEPVASEFGEVIIDGAQIEATHQQSQGGNGDHRGDVQPTNEMIPSSSELMQSLNIVRRFMEIEGLTSNTSFEKITRAVQTHISSYRIQTSITQFFHKY